MTTSEERSVTILLGKVEIIYRNDPLGTPDIFVWIVVLIVAEFISL